MAYPRETDEPCITVRWSSVGRRTPFIAELTRRQIYGGLRRRVSTLRRSGFDELTLWSFGDFLESKGGDMRLLLKVDDLGPKREKKVDKKCIPSLKS